MRLQPSLAALLCALLVALSPVQAGAQSYKAEYKLSTAVGPAFPWGKGAEIWSQLVKARTGGRINVRQFPGASAVAGDPAREFGALREGSIDMAVGSTLNWAKQVRALNLFALPFLVGDRKALDALLRGEVGAALMRAVEEAGVIPLAWGDNDFRDVSTAQRALRRPEDLAGLRIRVTGSLLMEQTFIALGAVPVRMKWQHTQNAMLERGLDGQETTAQVFVAANAHTLGQRHVTLWAVAADPLLFAVSRAAWDGWSAEDREIVRQAAREAAGREIGLARSAAATAEAVIARDLKSAGVNVTRLTPEERAGFGAATRPLFDLWAADLGVDLVRSAQEAIAASRLP